MLSDSEVFDLRPRLTALSANLWWGWNTDLDPVFRSIDPDLWTRVGHNPVAFLRDVTPDVLEAAQRNAWVLAQTTHAEKTLREYLESDRHWASSNAPGLQASPVAYFSAEIGVDESLPIYSGGLGILAGDHLKSCSDLGVPTYGVSLLYRDGYFTQQIDADGNQVESYRSLDADRSPIEPIRDANGATITLEFAFGDGSITAELWEAKVGRCSLILLDILDCAPALKPYASRLYGGDVDTRILQEFVLGIGGYRALRALGVRPGVLHLNEGHCAFAALEAVAQRMEETGLPFGRVAPYIVDSVAFTTHTPVEAGHDRFAPGAVLTALRPVIGRLGLSDEEFLGFGRVNPGDPDEPFCMTVLAIKMSHRTNAVSSLHAAVSRRMWQSLWPARRVSDAPVGHITNGAHLNTWVAEELSQLYADSLGPNWKHHVGDADLWRRIESLDDFDLARVKLALKQRLLDFVATREDERNQRLGLDDSPSEFRFDVLTIGFARRVASYKRALLLFDDMDRARQILTDPKRPVQIIFAGKAHPADEPGKAISRRLVEISRDPVFRNHVTFIEDYDKPVTSRLIQGCDLWLNTPRRPLEACGTSGMKAVFNATLNCSTLDGWWGEAYDTLNGFAFGEGRIHESEEAQDRHDALALLNVLEREVIPLYYDREDEDIPVRWSRRVKHALKTLAWRYNSDRMVKDYTMRVYLPAAKKLTADVRCT